MATLKYKCLKMGDSDPILMANLNYYLREKHYSHVQRLASEALNRYANDASLMLLNSLALLLQDCVQDAIRHLEGLIDQPDVSIGATFALIHAHKSFKSTDKEAIQKLENKVKEERKHASDKSHYHGALYLFHTAKYDKAKELLEKVMKTSETPVEVLCLRGWLDLYSSRDIKGSVKYFDDALALQSAGSRSLPDAYLGKCKYFELRSNFNGSLETLNQISAQHPNFLPTQIEKMKVLLMQKEWEQCFETAERCKIMDSGCISAQTYRIIYNLCFENLPSEAEYQLKELLQILEKDEPKNWRLYLEVSRLFARICGRNPSIMQLTKSLCEVALSLVKDKGSSEVQVELGTQLRLMGSNKQAIKTFRQSLEAEDGSINALIGIVHCQIQENELAEAEAQLEFLKEVHRDVKSFELRSCELMLAKRKPSTLKSELSSQFSSVVEEHFASIHSLPFGPQYFVALDPQALLEVVTELYELAPPEAVSAGQSVDASIKAIIRILEPLVESMPSHSEGLYLLGKAKFLSGDAIGAEAVLDQCLTKDKTFSDAHIMMAQIYLLQGNFRQASHSLEVGLSFNFEVRDHPLYHLIKARIQKKSKDLNTAVQTLETAMTLPSFKKQAGGTQVASTSSSTAKRRSQLELTASDRASVYLELIECYQTIGKTEEARKLMSEAQAEFQGTKEEQRLMLSNAELALAAGDVEKALQQLESVDQNQPHYAQARQKMAHIYLHHKKDKRQFAQCYRELVENNPSPQAYIMLGDAHMGIQEPERAIEVYETAMKKDPKNHQLARKIGQAYVRSHNYAKAVNYYEAALKSGQQSFLRLDLAELLFKLKNYDKCERVLKQGLERQAAATGAPDISDMQRMQDEVKFLALLSKVYLHTGTNDQAVAMLAQAKEQQAKIIRRGFSDMNDSVVEQKQTAANICCQLARYHENRRDFEKAINLYKEALTFNENDVKEMHALAHLYLLTGDLDACNEQCLKILKYDKDNNQATLMLADIMYQKNQSDAAMFHFQQLLERNPNQYSALARVIELLWRAGELDQAEKYIQRAEQANGRASLDAGFNYCKGLYEWYTGDPNFALQHFNRARRDQEWGERALYNMIEICINPDNEIIGGEVFEHGDATTDNTGALGSGTEKQDAQETGVRTAEKFLKELGQRAEVIAYRYQIMEKFVMIASKNRASMEEALAALTEMVAGDNGQSLNVGAILGIARTHMIMKQVPKAKQQLKRVLGYPWNFEEADFLEQCWLLLADTYINQSKYDVASDILKTCLQHNASCLKAYEYMGFIKEKEQKWAEAAQSYEKAWLLSKRRNPTIGYKLGFNYLKSKRFVDAIDVSHRVLELFPNYPKIRKDILEKARCSLRM